VLHAELPSAISSSTANDSAHLDRRRYAHTRLPSTSAPSSISTLVPNPPGHGPFTGPLPGVSPLQYVFATAATCVPLGDSVTWLGAIAHVRNWDADAPLAVVALQLNVTVPLKPGIGVSSKPTAICAPGVTGIGVVGVPPAGGIIASVKGTATMLVELVAVALAEPPPETVTVFVTVVGEVAVTFTVTVMVGYDAPAARASLRVHVFSPQLQPVPDIEASESPSGRFSVTVTVPLVAETPVPFETVTV